VEALKLALHTLIKLEFHMQRSGRVLNDLRILRRLLLEERTVTALTARPQADGKAKAETLVTRVAPRLTSRIAGTVGAVAIAIK